MMDTRHGILTWVEILLTFPGYSRTGRGRTGGAQAGPGPVDVDAGVEAGGRAEKLAVRRLERGL